MKKILILTATIFLAACSENTQTFDNANVDKYRVGGLYMIEFTPKSDPGVRCIMDRDKRAPACWYASSPMEE